VLFRIHGCIIRLAMGKRVLAAGPGFGGSCFPRDTVALIKTAHDHGAQLRRLEAVVRSLRAPPPRLAR
jgi:UDPglucose 6-dehydrogenase